MLPIFTLAGLLPALDGFLENILRQIEENCKWWYYQHDFTIDSEFFWISDSLNSFQNKSSSNDPNKKYIEYSCYYLDPTVPKIIFVCRLFWTK